MSDAELPTLIAFFKAMSNESRLRIVGLLAARERSVRELADLLGLKEPTVSHHLAALKQLGIVAARAEGVTRWHKLQLDTLSRLNRSLLEQPGVGSPAPPADEGEASEDQRVLAGYLDSDGRLTAIPASRRKRIVILKWLTRQFAEGRRYREAEVNEVLKRRHPDCATLRRELIIHRMMAREAGVYWRLPEPDWRLSPEG